VVLLRGRGLPRVRHLHPPSARRAERRPGGYRSANRIGHGGRRVKPQKVMMR
jgi:hypothetical protein